MSSKVSKDVLDKAAHVKNLVEKRNWTQIKKLANDGVQAAIDAVKKREAAKKAK
jgi:hypothetical protein